MEKRFVQGVKVGTLGRQNERNSSYVRLAHTSIFGLCLMLVCLMKSNCYSLIYSSVRLYLLDDLGSEHLLKDDHVFYLIWKRLQ